MPYEVIQGHQFWYQSLLQLPICSMRLPICE